MDRSAYLAIVAQYVDLGTLLTRARELRDRCLLMEDTAGREDLWAACELIERTKARLGAVMDKRN